MNLRRVRPSTPDEQRFERLYAEHFRAIAGYLKARTDSESAVDAVSRTFEIAWRRLSDVPEEPRGWLFGVARRVLADQRRAAGRQDTLIERIAGTLAESSEDSGEALVLREIVLSALRELAPLQREALLLVAWDGLSHREAAAALGCSSGALAVRLHRARKQLRAVMSHQAHQQADGSAGPLPAPPLSNSPKEAL
jgi:RNA polymerase sigma-70 factor (ECF subfamily)